MKILNHSRNLATSEFIFNSLFYYLNFLLRDGGSPEVTGFDSSQSTCELWSARATDDGFVLAHPLSGFVIAFTRSSNGWFDIRDDSGEATIYTSG